MSVELRRVVQWHDQVDFAIWMAVAGARDIVHLHDIDRVSGQVIGGLDDAPVMNSTLFVFAHPARVDRVATGLENLFVNLAVCRETGVEIGRSEEHTSELQSLMR